MILLRGVFCAILFAGCAPICKPTTPAVPQPTPPGYDLQVDVRLCREDREGAPDSNDFQAVVCTRPDGGHARVRMPVRAWWDIKLRDIGNVVRTPGK